MIEVGGRRWTDVVLVLQRTRSVVAGGFVRNGSLVAEGVILCAMVRVFVVELRRLLVLIEHFLRVHIVVFIVVR